MDSQDLTEVEREILRDLYRFGNDSPAGISEGIGRHEKSVSGRLRDLREKGLVRPKRERGGTWELTVAGVRVAQALEREERRREE